MGQPGIQIGTAFWDMLLSEHGIGLDGNMEIMHNSSGDEVYHYPFFSQSLKEKYSPRAIFVDADPNLINELKRGKYKAIISKSQLIGGKQSCSSNVRIFFYI